MKSMISIPVSKIGQVPGQLYNVQVFDSSNNPIKTNWAITDQSNNPMTSTYQTDDTGHFHFTYPDNETFLIAIYNPASATWVGYGVADVAQAGYIVLDKGTPSDSKKIPTAVIVLSGAALIAYLSTRDKKITGLKNFTPTQKKVLIIGGVGIGAYIIYNAFFNKPTKDQLALLSQAKTMLQFLANNYGIIPSMPAVQFASFASIIRTAVNECGTDENSIYSVFSQLNNEADIYQLIVSCGVLSYKGCFEGSYFGNVHNTLPEAITADMSGSEVDKINNILAGKQIQYRF